MAKTRQPGKKAMPHLAAALLCEKILAETNAIPPNPTAISEVLSVIRIVDTVFLPGTILPEPGNPILLPLTMLVMFRSGDARGERELEVRLTTPSKKQFRGGKWPIQCGEPPEGGHVFRVEVTSLQWEGQGLYWFDILLDSVSVSRVPLHVKVLQQQDSPPHTPVSGSEG